MRTAGFTLVETLVSLAVISLITIGIFSTMLVFSREIEQGTREVLEGSHENVFYEYMARTVRLGNRVLAHDEIWNPTGPRARRKVEAIKIIDEYSGVRGRFQLSNGFLEEDFTGGGWKPVMIGGDSLLVCSSSFFSIPESRRFVTVSIRIAVPAMQDSVCLPRISESIRCRN